MRSVAVERVTIGQLLDLLVLDYSDRKVALPPGQVEAWRAALGHVPAARLETFMVEDVVRRWRTSGPDWPGRPRERVRPIGDGTANRYVAILSAALAVGRRKIRHFAYAPTLPHFAETARGRYMPENVFQTVRGALTDEVLRDFFTVAYRAGVRFGQLAGTRISNVDAESWTITWIPDQTKPDDMHVLPLAGEALEAIKRRWAARDLRSGYLFHRDGKAITPMVKRRALERVERATGVRFGRKKEGGYVFHDTRHSAITNMQEAGIDQAVGMSITGHRTASVYQRYGVRRSVAQRAALERAESHAKQEAQASNLTAITGADH